MTRSAFVLGGTGLIGRAVVPMLMEMNYDVVVGTRTGTSVEGAGHVTVDRSSDEDFARATAGDHDLFVDIVAFNEDHARQLLQLEGRVGSMVVISSAAVYADPDGTSWLASERSAGRPIRETDPVVAPVPDGSDYAGGKIAVESLLLDSNIPVTILRPSAIFGPGDRASREWYFVKRVIDDRPVVLLAADGRTTFHPVSSATVAEMIVAAGERPGRRAINSGDPDPRNVRGICQAVAGVMEHEWEVVDVGTPPNETLGVTPWTTPHSITLDLSIARDELGWNGAMPYDTWLAHTCDWLLDITKDRPWQEVLPRAATYYGNLFDYAAEDDFLSRLRRQ